MIKTKKLTYPSPAAVFPSSHVSPLTMSLSPQMLLHFEGTDVQVKPGSILQVELHPSPLPLPQRPPSSHCSLPTIKPSSQIGLHYSQPLTILHVHPGSTLQLKQPSPLMMFLSSHCSVPTLIPSPQISVQVSGVFELPPAQFQPFSTLQLKQPSPAREFPSSQ